MNILTRSPAQVVPSISILHLPGNLAKKCGDSKKKQTKQYILQYYPHKMHFKKNKSLLYSPS